MIFSLFADLPLGSFAPKAFHRTMYHQAVLGLALNNAVQKQLTRDQAQLGGTLF